MKTQAISGGPAPSAWIAELGADVYRKRLRSHIDTALARLIEVARNSNDADVRGACAIYDQIRAHLEALTPEPGKHDDDEQ